ncbi:uncharacterized protein TNCV_186511 [Trichonephila clavipes]|nr:uncharacterized protein TNCV_186511 [Trichonephila clavipes]
MLLGGKLLVETIFRQTKTPSFRALTEEWDKLPQQLLDNVVQTPLHGVSSVALGLELMIRCPQARDHNHGATAAIQYLSKKETRCVFERQSLKNACNKLGPDLEGEKDSNDDHRKEITDFVKSIPGFQECNEDVETWRACDAEDCGFQMLNDDEIVIPVQEKSDPVDDETDEDEDNNNNNNESSKGSSNADAFSALETAMGVVRTTIRTLSYYGESQKPCNEKTKVYNGTAKNK